MLVSEQSLEKAIKKFFEKAKIKRPDNYSLTQDWYLLKKSVPAFIEALKEIENVSFCYGFDIEKVFEENTQYQLQLLRPYNKTLNLT
jgi:HEPN domain-containing protein